jgi:hypothetical protein
MTAAHVNAHVCLYTCHVWLAVGVSWPCRDALLLLLPLPAAAAACCCRCLLLPLLLCRSFEGLNGNSAWHAALLVVDGTAVLMLPRCLQRLLPYALLIHLWLLLLLLLLLVH